MAKEKQYTPYLVELLDSQFPLGLIARELLRDLDALQVLCFQDNEYGVAAGVSTILQNRMVNRLNRLFRRCGKKATILSLIPSSQKHHSMVVRYLDLDGEECETLFTLFEPSRRMRSAEREQNPKERGLSKPRRGAKVAKKRKRKNAKK